MGSSSAKFLVVAVQCAAVGQVMTANYPAPCSFQDESGCQWHQICNVILRYCVPCPCESSYVAERCKAYCEVNSETTLLVSNTMKTPIDNRGPTTPASTPTMVPMEQDSFWRSNSLVYLVIVGSVSIITFIGTLGLCYCRDNCSNEKELKVEDNGLTEPLVVIGDGTSGHNDDGSGNSEDHTKGQPTYLRGGPATDDGPKQEEPENKPMVDSRLEEGTQTLDLTISSVHPLDPQSLPTLHQERECKRGASGKDLTGPPTKASERSFPTSSCGAKGSSIYSDVTSVSDGTDWRSFRHDKDILSETSDRDTTISDQGSIIHSLNRKSNIPAAQRLEHMSTPRTPTGVVTSGEAVGNVATGAQTIPTKVDECKYEDVECLDDSGGPPTQDSCRSYPSSVPSVGNPAHGRNSQEIMSRHVSFGSGGSDGEDFSKPRDANNTDANDQTAVSMTHVGASAKLPSNLQLESLEVDAIGSSQDLDIGAGVGGHSSKQIERGGPTVANGPSCPIDMGGGATADDTSPIEVMHGHTVCYRAGFKGTCSQDDQTASTNALPHVPKRGTLTKPEDAPSINIASAEINSGTVRMNRPLTNLQGSRTNGMDITDAQPTQGVRLPPKDDSD